MARLLFSPEEFDTWHAEQRRRSGVPLVATDSRTLATVERIITDAIPEAPAI